MNKISMKALLQRAKDEKRQQLQQQNQQQNATTTSTNSSTINSSQNDPSSLSTQSESKVIPTTQLPLSLVSKLQTPKLPQSFVQRINEISLSEVEKYICTELKDLYQQIPGTICGEYNQIVYNTPDYVYIRNFLSPMEEFCIITILNSTPQSSWNELKHRHLMMYGGIVKTNGLEAEILPQWMNDLFDKLIQNGIYFEQYAQNVIDEENQGSNTTDLVVNNNDQNNNTNSTTNTNEIINESTTTTTPSQYPSNLLSPIISTLQSSASKLVRPNHTLLNYYSQGDYIMPHKDGPAYSPQAVIISLLSSLTLSYWDSLSETKKGITSAKMNMYLEPRSLFIMRGNCYHELFHGIDGLYYEPILNTHINKNDIQYTSQLLNLHDFQLYVDDLESIRGLDDELVMKYKEMIDIVLQQYCHANQIEYQKHDQNQQVDDTNDNDAITTTKSTSKIDFTQIYCISQRSERISLTIRRVDPILKPE